MKKYLFKFAVAGFAAGLVQTVYIYISAYLSPLPIINFSIPLFNALFTPLLSLILYVVIAIILTRIFTKTRTRTPNQEILVSTLVMVGTFLALVIISRILAGDSFYTLMTVFLVQLTALGPLAIAAWWSRQDLTVNYTASPIRQILGYSLACLLPIILIGPSIISMIQDTKSHLTLNGQSYSFSCPENYKMTCLKQITSRNKFQRYNQQSISDDIYDLNFTTDKTSFTVLIAVMPANQNGSPICTSNSRIADLLNNICDLYKKALSAEKLPSQFPYTAQTWTATKTTKTKNGLVWTLYTLPETKEMRSCVNSGGLLYKPYGTYPDPAQRLYLHSENEVAMVVVATACSDTYTTMLSSGIPDQIYSSVSKIK